MQKVTKQFLIHFSYHGLPYNGVQINRCTPKPVAKVLKETLTYFLPKLFPSSVMTSSRTDKSVHAVLNTARFLTHSHHEFNLSDLRFSMNKKFASDKEFVNILQIKAIPEHINIIAGVQQRRYFYRFQVADFTNENLFPFSAWDRHSCMLVSREFDVARAQVAADLLSGCHDFSGFSNLTGMLVAKSSTKTVRVELESNIAPSPTALTEHPRLEPLMNPATRTTSYLIRVSAESFMQKMVRNLAGCILDVGTGRITIQQAEDVLRNGVYYLQEKPFRTAPPEGLYLYDVFYDDPILDLDLGQLERELKYQGKLRHDVHKFPLSVTLPEEFVVSDSSKIEAQQDDLVMRNR